MLGTLSAQQVSFLVILVVAFALLLTERLRNDLVAMLIIVALAVTRVLKPVEALSGFGSEPALAVAGIFVLSGAFYQTGVSNPIAKGAESASDAFHSHLYTPHPAGLR